MNQNNKLSTISKVFLVVAALLLVISLFVPVWSIYLDAPQYPEGLSLQIWANKIAGDVEIINGLNHYIGMKTLHTEDFIEFKILPYLLGFFALLFLIAAVRGTKRWLYIVFTAFVIFGIVAMADFWKWEYDYGHNLDPNAAIQVPGMAYQPPLIGFKQLLNFGAYSIPDVGGWLFLSAGMLLLVAVLIEKKVFNRFRKKSPVTAAALALLFVLSSCSNGNPEPIALNKDACEFCKMTISDAHFMTSLLTKKGRTYKFDDIVCMNNYTKTVDPSTIEKQLVANFEKAGDMLYVTNAWFVTSASFKSPMGGNTAAFDSKAAAGEKAAGLQSVVSDWKTLNSGNAVPAANQKDHEQHP